MSHATAYLDAESRQLELATRTPRFTAGPRTDVVIALVWGAFVGLVKATGSGTCSSMMSTSSELARSRTA